MIDKNERLILCIPERYVPMTDSGLYLDVDFFGKLRDFSQWVPRGIAEEDDSIKQVIPYIVVTDSERSTVLAYQRSSTHTEGRLAELWSVGFGGHIEIKDFEEAGGSHQELLRLGIERELKEEINLPPESYDLDLEQENNASMLMYIEPTETGGNRGKVNAVHLGYVVLLSLARGAKPPQAGDSEVRPKSLTWLSKQALDETLKRPEVKFEDWSLVLIKNLLFRENLWSD